MEITMEYLQKQIDELKEAVGELKKGKENIAEKKNLPIKAGVGDTFEVAGIEWKVLDIVDGEYRCLGDKIDGEMRFDDDSNNWDGSSLRKYLNGELYEKIIDEVGTDNLVLFQRDLTSLDGQTEYGYISDYVSLLTVDEYRKYRSLIPNVNGYWWWLVSSWSTPCNGVKRHVSSVWPGGDFNWYYCYYNGGVRPFVSFSSSIFESEDE